MIFFLRNDWIATFSRKIHFQIGIGFYLQIVNFKFEEVFMLAYTGAYMN